MLFWQLFSSYVFVEKAAKMTLVRKIRTYKFDEIDGSLAFNIQFSACLHFSAVYFNNYVNAFFYLLLFRT